MRSTSVRARCRHSPDGVAVYYIGMVLQEAAERQPLPPSTTTYRQPGFASPMAQSFAVPTQQFGMVQPMVQPMAAMATPASTMFPGGGPRGAPLPYPSTAGQPGSQSQQIYVPNELVGAIIGRGGNQINAIRQMSQSCVHAALARLTLQAHQDHGAWRGWRGQLVGASAFGDSCAR